jgi:hypothetical protein
MLIGLTNKLCDIIGFVDILDFGNLAQLVFNCALSFGMRFCGGLLLAFPI